MVDIENTINNPETTEALVAAEEQAVEVVKEVDLDAIIRRAETKGAIIGGAVVAAGVGIFVGIKKVIKKVKAKKAETEANCNKSDAPVIEEAEVIPEPNEEQSN